MATINKEDAYILGAAQKKFREEYKKKKRTAKIRGNILWTLFLILLGVIMFNVGFIVYEYHGSGMSGICSDGDIVITNRLAYLISDPIRGEIVTIETDSGYDLKRIVGLPGDQINFNNGDVYINGSRCIEEYITGYTESDVTNRTVEEGTYFLLNDDRHNLSDSRQESFSTHSVKGAEITVIHVPDVVKNNSAYQSIRDFCAAGADITKSISDTVADLLNK